MRLALLADIHGNHFALQAVLDSIKRHEVGKLLIAGDFLGYYFWPREVLELLSAWDVNAIRGNHEDMFVKAGKSPEFLEHVNANYGEGLQVALDTLTSDQINWLENLPHSLEFDTGGSKILLCHGSPWDPDEYIYPDADNEIFEKCAQTGYDWIILGHTHYPMINRSLNATIVNPGSVGQPRNRQPGAQWALLDTESCEINLFCEKYNATHLIKESRGRHPELPYLADVLVRK
ncbi:MAG: metallophosphoesterase family protein [Proteobacteria bacterium]|nr:metallophosphoesterase [Pseudomonadota bacterium]NOG59086.1 metallophosphoesterase family protein [Pseudomonadota bacterium]